MRLLTSLSRISFFPCPFFPVSFRSNLVSHFQLTKRQLSTATADKPQQSTAQQAPARVRYAPSPTGSLHLGGLRTALYNYLLARQTSGQFILRIEDTDQNRLVAGSVEELINGLKWCGIDIDEGVTSAKTESGSFGPYTQSKRLSIYQTHIQQLIDSGHAYACFCSSQRLSSLSAEQKKRGLATHYDRLCLSLPFAQSIELMRAEMKARPGQFVIRMKAPTEGFTRFNDLIRGNIQIHNKTIGDQILMKADNFPTYHFASVVDDHCMRISHVIRGDEWIISTAKHVLLYNMFGWQMPIFAHLSLLLKHNSTVKLSKRDPSTNLSYYIDKGFEPEAVVSFVARLGHFFGDEDETADMSVLIDKFCLENVAKAGAQVVEQKLLWLNGKHLCKKIENETAAMLQRVKPHLQSMHNHAEQSDDYLPLTDANITRALLALRERIQLLNDFYTFSYYCFSVPDYSSAEAKELMNQCLSLSSRQTCEQLLRATIDDLSTIDEQLWTEAHSNLFLEHLKRIFTSAAVGQKQLMFVLRPVLTGMRIGPGMTHLLVMLGKKLTIQRLTNGIQLFKQN